MKIYNRTCSLFERHAPAWQLEELKRIPLFHFPYKWAEWNQEHQDKIPRFKVDGQFQLRLPFLEFAFEDNESLVLIKSKYDDIQEPQNVIRITDIKLTEHLLNVKEWENKIDTKTGILVVQGAAGRVTFAEDDMGLPKVEFGHTVFELRIIGKKKGTELYQNFEKATLGKQYVKDDIRTSLRTTLEQLYLLTTQYVWLVSRRPEVVHKPRRIKTAGKRPKDEGPRKSIPRANERPVYLLLTDKERKKVFPGSEPTEADKKRKSPCSHPRRGHWRRSALLGPDGKHHITWIKAMWIGPEVVEHEGRKYKVHLDL